MFHGIMMKLKWNTVLIYIEVSYNLGIITWRTFISLVEY